MNILVVGAGAMGRHHIRNYAAMSIVKHVHVVEPDINAVKKLSEMQLDGKITIHKTLEDALLHKIQASSVVVPTEFHAQIAGCLLEKKIPCLVEKPLAANLNEGKALQTLSQKHNVPLLVGHVERFNPAVQTLRHHIKKIGKIAYASTHRFGVPTARKLGNAFFDQAVHDIDVLAYITGQKPKNVRAIQQSVLDENDVAAAILDFGDFYASVEANRVTPIKTRELIIAGTQGSAKLDYITQELTITLSGEQKPESSSFDEILWRVGRGTEMKPYFVKKEPLKVELEHFLAVCQGTQKPLCTAQDGLNAIATAEACILSAKTGKVTPIA